MGKAFTTELAALDDTYDWARAVPLGPLQEFASEARTRSLLAIGSGGSATAAHLAAMLHRRNTGSFARHATPLDFLLTEPHLGEAAVLLLSASGRNRDVLATLKRCIDHDARTVAAICTRRGSPLAAAAHRFERAAVFEENVPCGKDGFLATNSLLATSVLIARAYGSSLPERAASNDTTLQLPEFEGRSAVVVLYGGWGSPVATDLESKLNESAIASALISDYRNFGHGRHLWLARRASETLIVALVTPETAEVAYRTRALIPRRIPVVQLQSAQEGPAATLDLLVQGFRLVGLLGRSQSFDPGRPAVPEFGRKLYRLAPPSQTSETPPAVMRKLARTSALGHADKDTVAAAWRHFVELIGRRPIGGIVLDYDGTLCARADRFGALRKEIAAECRRLLSGGIVLGIATGRGRSVREALQAALPRSSWDRIVVGYYNGTEIASLAREDVPDRHAPPEPPLDAANDLLESDTALRDLATLTPRRRQITVEPKRPLSTDALLSQVVSVLARLESQGVRVSASAHSVDVLPPGVGKLAVVAELERRVREGTEVLCIGDRGHWPGNDSALLSHVPSLSVDEVSSSLETCWNLAPAGVSGVEATLQYLRAMRAKGGRATLDASRIVRRT
ncbi:MAG: hypothetical protein ACT4PU_03335 [Planctomycetota bacterium]